MNENTGNVWHIGARYNKIAWVLCLGMVILFLGLNFLTPLIADDYGYPKGFVSVSAVAQETYNMFMLWNGRIVANFLTIFWLSAGKLFFNIANTLVYCLFVYLIQVHITGKAKFNPAMFLAVNIFLWFFVPAWGQNFLWVSGSCVYLWTITLMLLFLVPFRKKMDNADYKLNLPLSILLLCLGIFAGNSTENAAAAGLFLLISYFVVKVISKKQIALFEVAGSIGFTVGFLLLVLAPGNEIRQGAVQHYGEGFVAIKRIVGVTLIFGKDLGFALLAACGIAAYDLIRNKKRALNIFHIVYVIAALAGAFSMLLSPSFPPRAFLVVTVFAGIALGNVLWQTEIKMPAFVKRNFTAIAVCSFIALSFSFLNTSRNVIGVYMEWNRRVKHIEAEKAKGNFDIEVRAPIPVWDRHVAAHALQDIKQDKDAWPNVDIAEYFGLSSIRKNDDDDSWEVLWFR